MAKEDFCFTYYDGDAARDMSHMNRLERGAYTDMIISQRKFGRMTLESIKKTLGKDFEECWPSIEVVMKCEDNKFYIPWLETSVIKMKKHAKMQSIKGKKGGHPKTKTESKPEDNQPEAELKPNVNQTLTNQTLKEDGDGDENGFVDEVKGVQGENDLADFADYERWTELIIAGNDQMFETKISRERFVVSPEQLVELTSNFLGLLATYPNKKPPDHHRFILSLIAYIREKVVKQNGNNKLTQEEIEKRKQEYR